MTAGTVLDVAAAGCILIGALLSLSAGVALVRFPDLLTRMHAATKPQVLGLLLVLLGCALRLRTSEDITTLVLVGMFQLLTAPVAAHMVGRAAYRDRQFRADLLVVDEFAPHAAKVGDPEGDESGRGGHRGADPVRDERPEHDPARRQIPG